ncbi:hypothetical protein J2X55_000431 [Microbacterium sp. 1154]|uniref:hypothetical protein n=1 Tax=Microbacterium sp. 1154 TaxID=2817733 RepID=UPI00285CF724|nr:hypothetical protein [Microbacterium sp. 1154]MDR6689532.1 hypothetical protein [Microbacterium sp. 1154]
MDWLDPRKRIRDMMAEPLLHAANLERGNALRIGKRSHTIKTTRVGWRRPCAAHPRGRRSWQ